MTEETDNHTIRLLQEMRGEMREMRGDLTNRLDDLTNRVDDLANRVDGNTLILNMLAGMLHDHENRIASVETRS